MRNPLFPVPWGRAGGALAMVAEMNRMENAARFALADLGAGSRSGRIHRGMRLATRLGLVLAALAGLAAAGFFLITAVS